MNLVSNQIEILLPWEISIPVIRELSTKIDSISVLNDTSRDSNLQTFNKKDCVWQVFMLK